MNSRYHNYTYDGLDIPIAVGDRYYGQDRSRDFWNGRENASLAGQGILNEYSNTLLSGAFVTQGAGHTINITKGLGIVNFAVKNPTTWAALPPTVATQDIPVYVEIPAYVNQAITGATTDGTTINYVKIAYTENYTNSRNRAKKTGSYSSETEASHSLTVNSTPPTAYEVTLQKFTTNGATITFVGTEKRGYAETGYIHADKVISGTNLIVKSPEIEIANRLLVYGRDITTDLTGLSASTWYVIVCKESNGEISAKTITTFSTGGGGNWDTSGVANNQLDMYSSIYDYSRKYCRAYDGTDYYRVLKVFKTNSTPNGVQNTHGYSLLFDIDNIPNTNFFVYRNANFSTTGATKLQYDSIVFDINSEWDTTNFEYESKFNQNVMLAALCNTATTSLSALTLRKIMLYDESANLIAINAWDGSVTRTALNMQFQREVKCVNGKQYSVQIDINDKALTGNIENNFIGFGK